MSAVAMSAEASHPLLQRLGLTVPVFQAPMAGVATPALAAAVSNAGGLGGLGLGAGDAQAGLAAIAAARALTGRPFNVNVFCHRPAVRDAGREAAWLARLAPRFARFDAAPPAALSEIYQSFVTDRAFQAALIAAAPPVVSFHFGLPPQEVIAGLQAAGVVLLASATCLAEAKAAVAAGIDAIVAQGWEAGGHRGIFDPDRADERLGTLALTRLLVRALDVPVIAAGGIMDGAGIRAALSLGAAAAQLGTAFIACPESAADAAYRAALASPAAARTVMTRTISGRPARALPNRLTMLGRFLSPAAVPAYPVAYDAAKALNAAARAKGEPGYGAQWAGQGAPLARALPAATLMATLKADLGL
ncbi:nitronate monooxygenase [Pseudoxanthobacter sp.]|uniref:NAD(P)H-dependent flavin oxidoreductase n=1 Tax=Pseudoxanthobacter sp. TaxID=1925742 RepID=UPI002FDF713B